MSVVSKTTKIEIDKDGNHRIVRTILGHRGNTNVTTHHDKDSKSLQAHVEKIYRLFGEDEKFQIIYI